MKLADWNWVEGLTKLLGAPRPEPTRQAQRIVAMQLHVVLPAKIGVIAVVLYYLFISSLFKDATTESELDVVVTMLKGYFFVYVFCNAVATVLFILWRRLPPGLFQWLVFTLGLLDGIFMAGLTFITGGFESIVFWIFPGLIVLNATCIPLATPQIVLNVLLSLFYLGAGILTVEVPTPELWTPPLKALQPARMRAAHHNRTNHSTVVSTNQFPGPSTNLAPDLDNPGRQSRTNRPVRVSELPYSGASEEGAVESFPRLFISWLPSFCVLWLLTACCYGVQVLAERQKRALAEAREFALREGQLRSAGRLAAEFAHQIKNPLAIINNAAFSMQRALKAGRTDVAQQIGIIQEEVERSDRIVTQIMGYAQLTEGRVEKLAVCDELDRAIDQVFPPAIDHGVRIAREYAGNFPPLLMQQRHLSEILVNVLQNAREALNDRGSVTAAIRLLPDDSIEVSIQDDGPGIAPDKLERVFEAYYTTREKGTGLGLAIVKHNTDLYAGTVRVESELGKGARFVLIFPSTTITGPAKPT